MFRKLKKITILNIEKHFWNRANHILRPPNNNLYIVKYPLASFYFSISINYLQAIHFSSYILQTLESIHFFLNLLERSEFCACMLCTVTLQQIYECHVFSDWFCCDIAIRICRSPLLGKQQKV